MRLEADEPGGKEVVSVKVTVCKTTRDTLMQCCGGGEKSIVLTRIRKTRLVT